jgi:putative sigma-54 modulation protein
MNIIITAKNFKLTDGLKSAIHEKLERFEKMISESEPVRVVLETKRYGQKIEVTLPINNRYIKAESTEEDLYVAIDTVIDKLKRQISKFLDRIYDRETISTIGYEEDVQEQEEHSRIIKRKYISMKPMLEEEAILQMELLSHRTFMFYNPDEEAVCMLYKRNDGDYGILIMED